MLKAKFPLANSREFGTFTQNLKTKGNMDKDLNVVEYSIRVTSFRKLLREVCRKKGLEYPSDEKVAEWIENNGMDNVDEFIKDYEEKKGIFREPINDFIDEVNKIYWRNKPTEAEIKEFFEKNGNNVDLFCQQRTIAEMDTLERDVLIETLKLPTYMLVELWNTFIEESVKYGEDSYIYDLGLKEDIEFINKEFPNDIKGELTRLRNSFTLHGKTLRYFQWYNLNDNELHVKENIKGIIVAYWSEIFERIMGYAYCYFVLKHGEETKDYFDEVVWPICRKHLGYSFNESNGEVKYIGK